MPKYEVVSPIEHDGKKYKVGSKVELEGDQAEALVAAGAVKAKVEAEKEDDSKAKK